MNLNAKGALVLHLITKFWPRYRSISSIQMTASVFSIFFLRFTHEVKCEGASCNSKTQTKKTLGLQEDSCGKTERSAPCRQARVRRKELQSASGGRHLTARGLGQRSSRSHRPALLTAPGLTMGQLARRSPTRLPFLSDGAAVCSRAQGRGQRTMVAESGRHLNGSLER